MFLTLTAHGDEARKKELEFIKYHNNKKKILQNITEHRKYGNYSAKCCFHFKMCHFAVQTVKHINYPQPSSQVLRTLITSGATCFNDSNEFCCENFKMIYKINFESIYGQNIYIFQYFIMIIIF